MAIEFVVEDGSGLSTATSYIDVATFRQYWENRGIDYSAKTDDEIKVILNISTQYLDTRYSYQGMADNSLQSLQWPRVNVVNRQGLEPVNQIPKEVRIATCEAGRFYEQNGDFGKATDENISSKTVGPVSISYGSGGQRQTEINAVRDALRPYIKTQMDVLR